MKVVNRTRIDIDLPGFQIDPHHIYVRRSEDYHVGKRMGGELELSGFTPTELRNLHGITKTFAAVDKVTGELPPEALDMPEVKNMIDATDKMREHLARIPSLELLEQFERETDDGWYLYPRT
jgi:hypothetical protein